MNEWKIWVTLAVVVLAACLGGYAIISYNGMKSELATLKTQNTLLTSANQQCKDDIKKSNQAVDKLQKDSDARAQNARQALQAAAAIATRHEQEIASLRAVLAPRKGQECSAAQQLVDNYLTKARK